MSGVGLVALVVRMLLSLGVVLGVVAVAFVVARRRAGRGPAISPPWSGGSRRRSANVPIEVVGRAGLARGTAAVALRFGDSIVLVGVSEQAPVSVLTQIDAQLWDAGLIEQERLIPTSPQPAATRPSFFEALREATTRHA